MKYALIEAHKHLWPVRVQCRVLGVSASGYHQNLARRRIIDQRRHLSDEVLLVHIRAVYAENRGAYGWLAYPPQQAKSRLPGTPAWRQMRAQGVRVGKPGSPSTGGSHQTRPTSDGCPGLRRWGGKRRVQRLMKKHGIRARGRRRFRVMTTDSRHHLPVAPNVLDRKFDVGAPNRAWVGDFTYVATEQGWLYVAVVIDLFPPQRRKPVAGDPGSAAASWAAPWPKTAARGYAQRSGHRCVPDGMARALAR